MLIGEYTHTVDDKKRISLPVRFRKELGKKVIVTHGLDNCLFLYSPKQWEKISDSLSQMSVLQADSRSFSRFMLAGAVEVDVDSLGRILIPEFLRGFADLKSKVVFAGVHSRIEIWNDKRWSDYKRRVEQQVDMVAEKLGGVGAL